MELTANQIIVARAIGAIAKRSNRPAFMSVKIERGDEWLSFTATDTFILGKRTIGKPDSPVVESMVLSVAEFLSAFTAVEKTRVSAEVTLGDDGLTVKGHSISFTLPRIKDQFFPNVEKLAPFGEFGDHHFYEGDLPFLDAGRWMQLIAAIGPAKVVKGQLIKFGRKDSANSTPWMVLAESVDYGRFEGLIMSLFR